MYCKNGIPKSSQAIASNPGLPRTREKRKESKAGRRHGLKAKTSYVGMILAVTLALPPPLAKGAIS